MALDGGGRRYDGGEVPSGVWVVGKAKVKGCNAGRWWWIWNGGTSGSGGGAERREEGFFCPDAGETRTTRKHMNSGLKAARTLFSTKWRAFGILPISSNGQSRQAARHPLPCRDLEEARLVVVLPAGL
jgi:hypothetical protein